MIDVANLDLPYAPLTHLETYVAWEGPRTYALASTDPDIFYIVNDVDEDEVTGELFTLIIVVDRARFAAARSGAIPFRDVFTGAQHGTMHLATTAYTGSTPETCLQPFSAVYLPDRWLPVAGACLPERPAL